MCQLFAGIPAHDIEGETRSVRLGGHSTSIRLEAAFWRTLESLAASQGMTLARFLTTLHDEVLELNGDVKNFASHLRCACLVHLERNAAQPGTRLNTVPSTKGAQRDAPKERLPLAS